MDMAGREPEFVNPRRTMRKLSMTTPEEASIDRLPTEPFAQILSPSAYERFTHALRRGEEAMRGRTMWHINTTLKGGGVAEMLNALLPYLRGAGIDCRWAVVSGGDDFLAVTKRITAYTDIGATRAGWAGPRRTCTRRRWSGTRQR